MSDKRQSRARGVPFDWLREQFRVFVLSELVEDTIVFLNNVPNLWILIIN